MSYCYLLFMIGEKRDRDRNGDGETEETSHPIDKQQLEGALLFLLPNPFTKT